MKKETLAAVIFSSVLVLLALTPVHAQPIPVTACPGLVGASGTYILQNDISATVDAFPICFHVDASNVTIDLNGHTITRLAGTGCTTPGSITCGQAILTTFQNNLQNITVRGPGKIEGFTSGVQYQAVTKGSIENVFSENNFTGINVTASSSKIKVEENIVLGSVIGIGVVDSEKNAVANNEAIGNNQGIVLANTEDTDVNGNNATYNVAGISVSHTVAPVTPNRVTENIAVGNNADIGETGGLVGSPFGTYADNFCQIGIGCPNFPDLKISHL